MAALANASIRMTGGHRRTAISSLPLETEDRDRPRIGLLGCLASFCSEMFMLILRLPTSMRENKRVFSAVSLPCCPAAPSLAGEVQCPISTCQPFECDRNCPFWHALLPRVSTLLAQNRSPHLGTCRRHWHAHTPTRASRRRELIQETGTVYSLVVRREHA